MAAAKRDLVCGLVFIAIGLFFAVRAWIGLPIGSPVSMGPGFFPLVLGLVLAVFGAVIAAASAPPVEALQPVGWHGILLISLAVSFFALAAQPLGMLPSLFFGTLIAAFAPRQARLRPALMLSAVLTAFNIGVFVLALRLPYPIIGEWLRELVR